mmetsp:Transcript_41278/g.116849  ORF Transcript_41278/g.116849 Transcript_41278/m.116849 type:complete len:256 (+) Transcript_41278:39-806(+)
MQRQPFASVAMWPASLEHMQEVVQLGRRVQVVPRTDDIGPERWARRETEACVVALERVGLGDPDDVSSGSTPLDDLEHEVFTGLPPPHQCGVHHERPDTHHGRLPARPGREGPLGTDERYRVVAPPRSPDVSEREHVLGGTCGDAPAHPVYGVLAVVHHLPCHIVAVLDGLHLDRACQESPPLQDHVCRVALLQDLQLELLRPIRVIRVIWLEQVHSACRHWHARLPSGRDLCTGTTAETAPRGVGNRRPSSRVS